MSDKPRILVITPVSHIPGVIYELESCGEVSLREEIEAGEFTTLVGEYDAIFTNPNKAKFFLGPSVLANATRLKIICTASTGTNHIDLDYCAERGIEVLSLRSEKELLESISSTAEHAFALTLASIRNIVPAAASVTRGMWDYEPFIGRQLDKLTIGVLGLGRLGRKYAKFAKAFGARVVFCDPFIDEWDTDLERIESVAKLFQNCDVVSIHIHVSDANRNLINAEVLEQAKEDVLIVNTSRGEVVSEHDLVRFLKKNPLARMATDVITGETLDRSQSPLLRYASVSDQVLVTPHVGGMTAEGQQIAFDAAAKQLSRAIKFAPGLA